jgi:tRNA nucleotidyltransferase (CCA-adding enzyme)
MTIQTRSAILSQVLKKVQPTPQEIVDEHAHAQKIIEKIKQLPGKHIDAVLAGSVARNTHLRGDRDLDIFVLYPRNIPRKEFETAGLKVGKAVFAGHPSEQAFSEHPYMRGTIEGYDVEIVPSYKIAHAGERQSAVDRTVLHNDYLQSALTQKHTQEILLLKQFLKGIQCYGAEIGTSSVPGYVAELLIVQYGTFLSTLKAVAAFEKGQVIDIKNQWNGRTREQFSHHLIVVDPTDKNRNVAAALSAQQYARFIAAARTFLKKPSRYFFFEKNVKPWKLPKVKKALEQTELVGVLIPFPKKELPDILQGQLKRLQKKLAKQLQLKEFRVKRSEDWMDEHSLMAIIIELENISIQQMTLHFGPEVTDAKNSEIFLKKNTKIIAGPRIEKGRWLVEKKRDFSNASTFLKHEFNALKKETKTPLKKALPKAQVLQKKEIITFYKKNKAFSQFLTQYLTGKERFLGY